MTDAHQLVPLKHAATVRFSAVDKKTVDDEAPVLLCNYTDVYYNDTITADMDFMRASASDQQIQTLSLLRRDVLLTKDSETADDIGIPAYVPKSLPGLVCGYHLAALRARPELLDGRYLFWLLSTANVRQTWEANASGVTRYSLRAETIGRLPVALPLLSAQRAIADFLDRETDRLDQLIGRRISLSSLLEERLRTVIAVRLFESDYKRSQLGRHLLRIDQGYSPICESFPAQVGDWGVLKLSAVHRGEYRPVENKSLPPEDSPRPRHQVRPGDLLVTRRIRRGSLATPASYETPPTACYCQI